MPRAEGLRGALREPIKQAPRAADNFRRGTEDEYETCDDEAETERGHDRKGAHRCSSLHRSES